MARTGRPGPVTASAGVTVGDWRGFEVGGRLVAVAGADAWTVAAVSALVQAGARVRVLAEADSPALEDLAARGRLELMADGGVAGLLSDASFLVLGTVDPGREDEILTLAAERNLAVCRLHPSDRAEDRADRRPSGQGTGRVILVGGGPGDPGLLTVAGLQAIKDAEVI